MLFRSEPTFTAEQLVPIADDIETYGVMKELVGRIPVITMYRPMTVRTLVSIMQNCENSALNEYKMRLSAMGHTLEFDSSALRVIAQRVIDRGTGARGLRTLFAEILTPALYELSATTDSYACVLRGKDIKANRPPQLCKIKPRRRFTFDIEKEIQRLKNEKESA